MFMRDVSNVGEQLNKNLLIRIRHNKRQQNNTREEVEHGTQSDTNGQRRKSTLEQTKKNKCAE